jgi:hypothetical protein
VHGEASKIREEFCEFEDALEQNNPVMALVELSDMLGAIAEYTYRKHNITLMQLLEMSNATQRAFADGTRKAG